MVTRVLQDQLGGRWAPVLAASTPSAAGGGFVAALLVGLVVAVGLFVLLGPNLIRVFFLLWRLPFVTPFLGVYLLGVLFLYYDAPFYADDPLKLQQTLTFYFVGLSLAIGLSFVREPLAGMSLGEFLTIFTLAFLVGAVLMAFIEPLNPESSPFTHATITLLILQGSVVAVVEELFFRFFIPYLFRVFGPWVAQGISALGFGFMHLAAYTQGLQHPSFAAIAGPIAFAAGLGMFFGAVNILVPQRGYGLVAGMGFHFSWNAYVLGFIGAS